MLLLPSAYSSDGQVHYPLGDQNFISEKSKFQGLDFIGFILVSIDL